MSFSPEHGDGPDTSPGDAGWDIPALIQWLETELAGITTGLGEWNLEYFSTQHQRFASDLDIIRRCQDGGEVLEVGSVPCHMTTLLKRLGYSVTGVDPRPESSGHLIEKFGLDVRKCDIETEPLPFEDESFGLIVFTEVFEHLRIDPIYTMGELRRVLRPGGRLFLSTPNLYASKMVARYLLGRGLFSPYEQFEMLRTHGFMGHVREYSPAEMRDFMEKCGFSIDEHLFRTYKEYGPIKGFIYDLLPKLKQFQILLCSRADIPTK